MSAGEKAFGPLTDKKASFKQFEPKITVSYKPNSDLNIYANWGIGFKTGGFNNQGSAQIITDNFVNRADVRALMGKVTRELDSVRDGTSFTEDPDDDLVFTMRDGSSHVLKLRAPRDQAIALDSETLWVKFLDCTSKAMDGVSARRLFDAMQSLDSQTNIAELPVAAAARAAAE